MEAKVYVLTDVYLPEWFYSVHLKSTLKADKKNSCSLNTTSLTSLPSYESLHISLLPTEWSLDFLV